ncbi:MAG: response regulator transcription factor [Gammaproteobacteria bacterium]|nr:response regulator transcription factor [Gammaproteobacteria bacterium]
MQKILLVDDDIELCELLSDYLSGEEFSVDAVHDGAKAAEQAMAEHYDLIILDVMLPNKNGFEILRELSTKKQTPVLMLTAKGDEIDRIVGLEMGADDYLAKPCNPRELVARIRSIIRRFNAIPESAQTPAAESSIFQFQDLTVDCARYRVTINQQPIELTATEHQILIMLVKQAGELVTREDISKHCLGRRLMAYDRSIDMHISHLRKKLGPASNGEDRIKTLRGVGYQYVAI